MAALSRHTVLVTQPLSDAARRRLEVFFDVQTQWEGQAPTRDELAESLQGKAGVLTDSRLVFDAALIARLPLLRAICHIGPGEHAFDLAACTRAGIRATSLPAQDAVDPAEDARAERLWEALLPLLQQAAPPADEPGRYGRWAPATLAAAPRSTLAILGNAPWVPALLALARAARVQPVQADDSASETQRQALWAQADVLLVCAGPIVTADELACLRPTARAFNLAGPQAHLGARIEDGAALLAPATQAPPADRTRIAAEDLVAALGFGRHGWHPPNLLNTEILCDSCC